jgi:hypothetical protein
VYNFHFTWKIQEVFAVKMEKELAEHCQDMDTRFYGLGNSLSR